MSVTVPSGTRRSREMEMKSVVGFEISRVCGKEVKEAGWRNASCEVHQKSIKLE